MMQHLPKEKPLKPWNQITLWVSQHQRISRLIILTVSLGIFIAILPPYLRTAFWFGLLSHKILAFMLLFLCLLSVSLVWSAGQRLDAWVFLIFNFRGSSRPIWLDRVMVGFTQLGSAITALGIAFLFFIFNLRRLSYEFILGTLTLWMVVELAKFLIYRSRPFIRLTQARIVGNRAIGRSFPSGHTSQVFFMATLTAQYFHVNLWVAVLLYIIAMLVGITRMYVGAHYPRDVLAGAILGSAWGILLVLIDEYFLIGSG